MTGGGGGEREVKCDGLPAATLQEAEESEQERAASPSATERRGPGQKKGENNSKEDTFFIVSISRLDNEVKMSSFGLKFCLLNEGEISN